MRAGKDHQRAVFQTHVVDDHCHRQDVVVGVRVEREILVPFDRRAEARGFHVQLGGVKADVRPDQVARGREDVIRVHEIPHHIGLRVRQLDAAEARIVGRVAVFEVEPVVRGCHRAGHILETGDFRADRFDDVERDLAFQKEIAFAFVVGLLRLGQRFHGVTRNRARRHPNGRVERCVRSGPAGGGCLPTFRAMRASLSVPRPGWRGSARRIRGSGCGPRAGR